MPAKPQPAGVNPFNITQFVEYEVVLLRKVSVVGESGEPPSPGTLTGDYERLVADAKAMWTSIITIHANYLIVDPGVPFVYGPMLAVGPDGGLAGCRLPVSWSIN
jgi:hypothetical protein